MFDRFPQRTRDDDTKSRSADVTGFATERDPRAPSALWRPSHRGDRFERVRSAWRVDDRARPGPGRQLFGRADPPPFVSIITYIIRRHARIGAAAEAVGWPTASVFWAAGR